MSRFIDDVERTIARARRSRNHALKFLDRIDGASARIACPERPARTARISIALASLIADRPVMIGTAHNLNRRITDGRAP